MALLSSSARGTWFDNSTNGFASSNIQDALEELKSLIGGATSGGVVPPFTFSKDGLVTVGTYFRTGTVATNLTGQMIKGINYAIEVRASNSSTVSSDTRIQFVKRTGLSSFVEIANLYVDILNGNYDGVRDGIKIEIGSDWEIGCFLKSGSNLYNGVVMIYLVPKLD